MMMDWDGLVSCLRYQLSLADGVSLEMTKSGPHCLMVEVSSDTEYEAYCVFQKDNAVPQVLGDGEFLDDVWMWAAECYD